MEKARRHEGTEARRGVIVSSPSCLGASVPSCLSSAMPSIEDDAVCIRHWDFSETSQTVSLLTHRHGIVRGLAKGAKREKGSFSGGIDVLTRGRIGAIIKPGRDLATLTHWNLEQVYPVLRSDYASNRVAWSLADLVHHMMTDQDPHPGVFEAMVDALGALGPTRHPSGVMLEFQWKLLCDAGYRPQLDADTETGEVLEASAETLAFSPTAGGIVADTGTGDRWRVRTATVEVLRQLARGESITAVDPTTADRANKLLATYIRELIGREPKSMGWVWASE